MDGAGITASSPPASITGSKKLGPGACGDAWSKTHACNTPSSGQLNFVERTRMLQEPAIETFSIHPLSLSLSLLPTGPLFPNPPFHPPPICGLHSGYKHCTFLPYLPELRCPFADSAYKGRGSSTMAPGRRRSRRPEGGGGGACGVERGNKNKVDSGQRGEGVNAPSSQPSNHRRRCWMETDPEKKRLERKKESVDQLGFWSWGL